MGIIGKCERGLLAALCLSGTRAIKIGGAVKFSPDKPRHEFANEEETTLSFLSGGTTSGPEVVKHTSATLRAAVNGLTERIEGGSK